jgi:hypothetical protein
MFKIAYSPYDGTYVSDCIALQTYSELPPVFGSVHHPPSKCFVSYYDVGLLPSLWLNPECWVQGSLNTKKNCFLSKAK